MGHYTRSQKRKADSGRNHLQSTLKKARNTLESWEEVEPRERAFFYGRLKPENMRKEKGT